MIVEKVRDKDREDPKSSSENFRKYCNFVNPPWVPIVSSMPFLIKSAICSAFTYGHRKDSEKKKLTTVDLLRIQNSKYMR